MDQENRNENYEERKNSFQNSEVGQITDKYYSDIVASGMKTLKGMILGLSIMGASLFVPVSCAFLEYKEIPHRDAPIVKQYRNLEKELGSLEEEKRQVSNQLEEILPSVQMREHLRGEGKSIERDISYVENTLENISEKPRVKSYMEGVEEFNSKVNKPALIFSAFGVFAGAGILGKSFFRGFSKGYQLDKELKNNLNLLGYDSNGNPKN